MLITFQTFSQIVRLVKIDESNAKPIQSIFTRLKLSGGRGNADYNSAKLRRRK